MRLVVAVALMGMGATIALLARSVQGFLSRYQRDKGSGIHHEARLELYASNVGLWTVRVTGGFLILCGVLLLL